MKKTPSALKWLAEKRGRVAHQVQSNASTGALLQEHIESLVMELEAARLQLACIQKRGVQFVAELSALDQTVKIYDETLDPTCIEPIKAWKGRYGERGALRRYLRNALQEASPADLSTAELAFRAMEEFSLEFVNKSERQQWWDNSLRRALGCMHQQGLVEKAESGLNTFQRWRWKQEQPKTLAELRGKA